MTKRVGGVDFLPQKFSHVNKAIQIFQIGKTNSSFKKTRVPTKKMNDIMSEVKRAEKQRINIQASPVPRPGFQD